MSELTYLKKQKNKLQKEIHLIELRLNLIEWADSLRDGTEEGYILVGKTSHKFLLLDSTIYRYSSGSCRVPPRPYLFSNNMFAKLVKIHKKLDLEIRNVTDFIDYRTYDFKKINTWEETYKEFDIRRDGK